jgi:hypothetical protein
MGSDGASAKRRAPLRRPSPSQCALPRPGGSLTFGADGPAPVGALPTLVAAVRPLAELLTAAGTDPSLARLGSDLRSSTAVELRLHPTTEIRVDHHRRDFPTLAEKRLNRRWLGWKQTPTARGGKKVEWRGQPGVSIRKRPPFWLNHAVLSTAPV